MWRMKYRAVAKPRRIIPMMGPELPISPVVGISLVVVGVVLVVSVTVFWDG